jgi:site-specific recombinase XerD
MNALAIVPPIAASLCITLAEAEAEMDAALSFAEAEKSEGTRRAYRSDFRIFTAWCRERGLEQMPATPATVARFLSGQATGGLKASTIGGRAAAIAYAHKLAGHEPPTSAESLKAVVRGIRRTIGTAPVRKSPATADLVGQMLATCDTTLRSRRDAALLALGFAGAFRRSELVALTVADLVDGPDGFRVMIRHSKTDQEGAGQEIAIPRGCRIRPVELVQAWLEAAGIASGPVFRQVAKGGRVLAEALSGHSAAEIVKRHAELAGLDPAAFAGHSLRAGYLTSAAEAGASALKMIEVSRHKSLDMLTTYVRRADLFRDHSGSAFL